MVQVREDTGLSLDQGGELYRRTGKWILSLGRQKKNSGDF
jgi:hypothetical protein